MTSHAALELVESNIELRRRILKTAVVVTILFVLVDSLAIYVGNYASFISSIISHVMAIGFTGYILYHRIDGNFKKFWTLYRGIPIYLGYDSTDLCNWIRETLPEHSFYFTQSYAVVVLRDKKSASIVKLMVPAHVESV